VYGDSPQFATSGRTVVKFFSDPSSIFETMEQRHHPDSLSAEELRALEERVARGETSFDEEMQLIVANGCRPDQAAFEAALERSLCRGEDPPVSIDDDLEEPDDTAGEHP
jgi:hypothetical protein